MCILKSEIPFTITQKILRYKSSKTHIGLFTRNYKMLMKEIKEDINKWRDLLYSITGRFNTIKTLILPKMIYTQF